MAFLQWLKEAEPEDDPEDSEKAVSCQTVF